MEEEKILVHGNACSALRIKQISLSSAYLERDVTTDIYIPKQIVDGDELCLLLINDGQDLIKMEFAEILDRLISSNDIEPLICVGIHCSGDRINEYGTICSADYKGRGAKAGLYNKFIFDELLPFIRVELNINSFKNKSFAGFSLGGLSAIDIVWNNPREFLHAAVFSGALWWRRKGYDDEGYDWDKDRIMHLQVQKGTFHPWLKFFFECGKLDETADRNNNGIIDSIEDTLDIIEDLKELGYPDKHIYYLELEHGEHKIETWAEAFPAFLRWGWGKAAK